MLEQIYDVKWLRKKPAYAFILGVGYSVLAIATSILLFPKDPALISVAIIALLLMPSLQKLAVVEEITEKKGRFNILRMFTKQITFYKVYLYLFLGIFFVYAFFALFLPSLATNHLFREQINIMTGGATFSTGVFIAIFTNNFKVLMFSFLISIIAGNGAIFIIAWNASVWGTIFGNLAKLSAFAVGKNPLIYFVLIILSIFPHMLLEVTSYILGIMSGTVISEGAMKDGLRNKSFKKVLKYNIILFLIAFIILFLGVLVETIVLNNSTTYATIIMQGFT